MGKRYYFRHFSTTADIGLTVSADITADLLRGAAWGMFSTMFDLHTIPFKKNSSFKFTADPFEELPILFLNEFLYLFSINKLVPLSFPSLKEVKNTIDATVSWGELTSKSRYKGNEIKAVTYQLYRWDHLPGKRQHLRIVFDV